MLVMKEKVRHDSLISVIVPVYNVADYLDQCVQSIVDQSYTNLEILLIDDGSTDECPQKCDAWAESDARIKVIHKENGGVSEARNVGLDLCSGEYIAFVDSDDWIHPEMLQRMLISLEQVHADICSCSIASCYSDRQICWGEKKYRVSDAEGALELFLSETSFPVCVWNKIYKRALWQDIRFPIKLTCGEDAVSCCSVVGSAERIVHLTDVLYYYRVRPESAMTAAFSKRSMDEEAAWRMIFEYIRDHFPKLHRKAFTCYLQTVNVLIHKLKRNQKSQFQEEYTFLMERLRGNLLFMLFCSTASLKYRIRFLIDVLLL